MEIRAIVTPIGILYREEHYSCSQALKENWFAKAAESGEFSLIAFLEAGKDRALMVCPLGQESFIPCYRLQKSSVVEGIDRYYEKMQAITNELRASKRKK